VSGAAPGRPLVEAAGLVKAYPGGGTALRVVDGVDLRVTAGEAVSVMGPSGCGKSTLLHLLGGLLRPDAGRIRLAGEPTDAWSQARWARARRRRIGFVFQSFQLIDDLTAVENVELAALLAGVARAAARRQALAMLERLRLADRAVFLPHRMSGGERQRVALARALVNHPDLILADEPTGSLDSAATTELLGLLREVRDQGQALLVVTHDHKVATMADRLLTMRDGMIIDETRLDQAATSIPLPSLIGWEDLGEPWRRSSAP
jgi:putative ABC transport system ATP-binding protein